MLFNWLGKTSVKNIGWKSLVKSNIELSALDGLKFSVPEGAKQVIKISGKKADGSSAEFFIFKDKLGRNLGSRSLYSDGTMREIDILKSESRLSDYRYESEFKCSIDSKGFHNSQTTIYHNVLKKKNKILYESTTMSDVYKNCYKNWPKDTFGSWLSNKKDIDDIYQEIIRVTKIPRKNGTIDFRQQVTDILTGSKKSKAFLDIKSTMEKDGEMVLNAMEHSQNVNVDTKNPYYQFGLLSLNDMLKAQYAKIVKERGFKGIEPPLILDYTGELKDAGGKTNVYAKYISINMINDVNNTKEAFTFFLGHECEHLFTQFADIYLSGLKNLKKSLNTSSRKFYNGLKQRFPKVEKGTERYNKAVQYFEDFKGYKKKTHNADGSINIIGHDALKAEHDANKAGKAESYLYVSWLANMTENFGLFNHRYINSVM